MKKTKNLWKYYRKQKRDWWEAFCDLHNRKFELVRTIGSVLGVLIQTCVLLKVFHLI